MILSQSLLNRYRNREVPFRWELSKFVMNTKYSRLRDQVEYNFSDNEKEEWWEVVARNIEGIFDLMNEHIPNHRLKKSKQIPHAREMYDDMFNFIWTPAGRPMHQIGSNLYRKRGGSIFNNCSFINLITEDFVEGVKFILGASFDGIGVGIKIGERDEIVQKPYKIRSIKHTIEDSVQGWEDAIALLIDSYLEKRKPRVVFDYSQIREKGSPISTGGTHQGYKPYEEMLENIREFLNREIGNKISTILMADIANSIGKCVVNGGQRRSAMILLAEQDDTDFKRLKDWSDPEMQYRFGYEGDNDPTTKKIAYQSNNSYLIEDDYDYTDLIMQIQKTGNGEPALVFIKNKGYGRLLDGCTNHDDLVEGCNPCAEMFLENWELCNLMEVNINNLMSSQKPLYDVFFRVLLFAKIISHVPTRWKKTNEVINRNHRIGIGLTGIVEYLSKNDISEEAFADLLDKFYFYIKKADRNVSQLLRTTESIKLTTVKPSGNTSLLHGTTAGINASFGEYVIRHAEVENTSQWIDYYRERGYDVKKASYKDVHLIAFPMKMTGVKTQEEQTIEEQFELINLLQTYYSDNAVSNTITYKEDELDKIVPLLKKYEDKLKSVSFLPLVTEVYENAPYMPVSQEEYLEYVSRLTTIQGGIPLLDSSDSKYCTTIDCIT